VTLVLHYDSGGLNVNETFERQKEPERYESRPGQSKERLEVRMHVHKEGMAMGNANWTQSRDLHHRHMHAYEFLAPLQS
jgi:hypothetical protein